MKRVVERTSLFRHNDTTTLVIVYLPETILRNIHIISCVIVSYSKKHLAHIQIDKKHLNVCYRFLTLMSYGIL